MQVLIIKWSLISCRRVPLPIPQENLPVTGIPPPSGPRPFRATITFNLEKTAKLQFNSSKLQFKSSKEKQKERVDHLFPLFFLTLCQLLCRSKHLFSFMGVTLCPKG